MIHGTGENCRHGAARIGSMKELGILKDIIRGVNTTPPTWKLDFVIVIVIY
jgi:hypothetical protein